MYNYTTIDASSGAKNVTVQVGPNRVPSEGLVWAYALSISQTQG